MELILNLLVFLFLLGLGFFVGGYLERKHYQSIFKREKALRDTLLIVSRYPLRCRDQRLVSGSVVISVDYFKTFLAGLRQIFGGRINSYESLLDRARREAVLRMKEQAKWSGHNAIYNVKFATSPLSEGNKAMATIEVLAYGTAVRMEK